MKNLGKVSRSVIVNELKDASKEIAVLYLEAKKLLHTLEEVIESTHWKWQCLVELAKTIEDLESEQLSIDDLAYIDSKLFAFNLREFGDRVLRQQNKIAELHNNAMEISQRISKLRENVVEEYQSYFLEE